MLIRRIGLTLLCVLPGAVLPAQLAGEKPEDALANAPKAMSSIVAKDLERNARKLASMDFGGRLTATAGQIKAADYAKGLFEQYGLEPYGDVDENGKRLWTQSYKVKLNKVLATSGLFDDKGKHVTKYGAWFVKPNRRVVTPDDKKPDPTLVEGQLVFAGRGRKTEIGQLDLDGKIPVFVIHVRVPRRGSVYSEFQVGGQVQIAVMGMTKRASERGAKGAIFLMRKWDRYTLGYLNMVTRYPGKPSVSLGWGNSRNMMSLMAPRPSIPALLVGDADTTAVLKALAIKPDVAFGYHRADSDDAPDPCGTQSAGKYRFALATGTEKTHAVNVVALFRGSDPKLADEAVIYSCHMDHLGLAADGGAFFGAADNGSGTSTVLEIAQAYSKLSDEERPKRSIIFLVVSGEELGLWGSAYYTKHPSWPLAKTIADINMDMLGRSTSKVPSDSIALTPTNRHPSYNTLAREAAWLGQAFGLSMANGDKFYARSDHYNFATRGVPVIFFCDDEHPDYHMVTDTPDKLEYDKMTRVGRLAFLVGYRTANDATLPSRLGKRPSWFK